MTDRTLAKEFGLNPEQATAATLADRHLCVEAGAGSGKTRVLVARLAGLLKPDRCTLDEVVAITFTRKAASEMRKRLRDAFRERANDPDVSPENQTHWRDLIRRLESARITTIDGFCASLLRENAVRLGVDPDFSVLDDSEAVLVRDEVARTVLLRMLEDGHLGARRFAEEFGLRELEQSILALLKQERAVKAAVAGMPFDDPQALYALRREQCEKAARESVSAFVEDAQLEETLSILDSRAGCCSDVDDKLEIARAGIAEAVRTLLAAPDSSRAANALADIRAIRKGAGKKENWDSATLKELRDRLGSLKEMAAEIDVPAFVPEVEQRAAKLTVDLYSVFDEVSTAYRDHKHRLHAMDFSDLLTGAVEALRSDAPLRKRLRATFKHILVDEFQDTDPSQFELVSLLRAAPDEPGAFIFIVGDVKQSIYRFRGADVDVFDAAKSVSDQTIPLATNYRSDPAILDFINGFYERSGRLASASQHYQPLVSHRESRGLSTITYVVPEEDTENAGIDEYRRREAELVAQRLLAMCGGEAQVLENGAYRSAEFRDVAILFRTHTAIPLFEQVLREHGVPFVIEQGRGYFDRQEIHDVVNLLKFIANPWDEVALVGFLRSPLASLSDDSLAELTAERRLAQAFYGDATLTDPDQDGRLAFARALVRECHAMRQAPVSDLLDHIYERTGFEAAQLALHHSVQRASNVRKLLDSAEAISASRTPDLHAFIRFVSQVHAYELVESEAPWIDHRYGAATLMTVHKSKGLEFPIVVLADSGRTSGKGRNHQPFVIDREYGLACKVEDEDGGRVQPAVFNFARKREHQLERAEDARILYVAMTRARDHLLISGSPKLMRDSWLDWHNQVFGIFDMPEGVDFDAGGTKARVTRTPQAVPPPAREDEENQALDIGALTSQTRPLVVDHRLRESIGVDQLLDLVAPSEYPERKPSQTAETDPLMRGRIVHRFFELWSAGPPAIEEVLATFDLNVGEHNAIFESLNQTREKFLASPLYDKYRNSRPLAVELPFMTPLGDQVMNGVIDAILSDGTIVDYKTGVNSAEKLSRYTRQLHLYAHALRCVDPDLVSSALIYFTDSGEVVDVDVTPNRVAATLDEVMALLSPGLRAS